MPEDLWADMAERARQPGGEVTITKAQYVMIVELRSAAGWLVAIWGENSSVPVGTALWEDIQRLRHAVRGDQGDFYRRVADIGMSDRSLVVGDPGPMGVRLPDAGAGRHQRRPGLDQSSRPPKALTASSLGTFLAFIAVLILSVVAAMIITTGPAGACESTPITPNTPTGVAGCQRQGAGVASHYGPGQGVAMNFCTWELRHSSGCGSVTITSVQTGVTVSAAVIDFCDCYTGTANERIVDLQYGVVEALGLNLEAGLYDVIVSFGDMQLIPDTAMETSWTTK